MKTSLKQIKEWMTEIAKQNNIPEQVEDTWRHSACVWGFAEKIADSAIKNGNKVDKDFLKLACYSHDIGRMFTGSIASKKIKDNALHGFLGAKFLRKKGLRKLARVCETHIGGVGLLKEDNISLGIGKHQLAPKTIEEKIVGYADARTFPVEKGDKYYPIIGSFKRTCDRYIKFNKKNRKRLIELQKFVHKITDGQIQ